MVRRKTESVAPVHTRASQDLSVSESAESARIDFQFLDDLTAANRFKAFLVGRGVDVLPEVLTGLGELSSKFKVEIEAYNALHSETLMYGENMLRTLDE